MTAIRLLEPSGSNGSIQFALDGDFSSSSGLVFVTGSERLGIGTGAPGAKLHVSGGTIFGGQATDLHQFTGSAQFQHGLSGSLTNLVDGSSYLVAGANVTIVTGANGQVTISSTGGGSSNNGCGVYWESTTSDTIATTGSVAIGGGSSPSQLWINGINLTPISGTLTIPGSTLVDTVLLNLTGALSGNQYGNFNIDIVGTTKGITNILNLSTAKWNIAVSMLQSSGTLQVVGVTELDTQRYKGPTSIDDPYTWDVNFNSSGSLFVSTAGTSTDTAWGAIVTNQTVIDVETGLLFSGKSLISGSLTSSGCECCHDPYWISNNSNVIFTTGSVVIGGPGTTNELKVNGINLTPISGSAVVPGSTSANYPILSLSGSMLDNQYANFNIDVVGSTKGITNISNISVAKRFLTVSLVKAGGQFTVVGITEADAQNYIGPASVDDSKTWSIDIDTFGTLYVNTSATPTDTAWGVIVTKKSVIDVNSGILIG